MKYFTIEELCRSNKAEKLGIENKPHNSSVKDNLISLVNHVLDPARERLGSPITVTSGYRGPKVNDAVGGVKKSQHLNGQAADLVCKDNKKLFDIIRDNLPYDQLIWEQGGKWVHVSYNQTFNRKQIIYT